MPIGISKTSNQLRRKWHSSWKFFMFLDEERSFLTMLVEKERYLDSMAKHLTQSLKTELYVWT
jgi:hypothetical protein